MRRLFPLLLVGLAMTAIVCGSEAWTAGDVIQPEQAAKDIRRPLVIHVGFAVLYRAAHIAGSAFAGPGSKPEGIEDLRKAVAGQPRTREIILYCGCCPWDKCPNIRPAFAVLHEMGYANVKVLQIATDLKADWIDKGYATEKRASQ